LPLQLEEEGHSSHEIAAVMGGYYWMGFVGGVLLTTYQIHGLLYGQYHEPSWAALRSHVIKLGVGLLLGAATLLVEATADNNKYASMHTVHLNCRLIQGFLGAFLFFYAYYLAATAFEGDQQVFCLTLATICLNVAEVFGPFIGAYIFSEFGLEMAYYVLAALSLLNNFLLLVVWLMFPVDPPAAADEKTALLDDGTSKLNSGRSQQSGVDSGTPRWTDTQDVGFKERLTRLTNVATDPILIQSLLVIAPAAMVKSSFESILPLFGDSHGYDVFQVGVLFTMIALGFIVASILLGYLWKPMSSNTQVVTVGTSLFLLGCISCIMLYSWGVDKEVPLHGVIDWVNQDHHYMFYICLVVYGVLLGLTHTGASLYLGEVIEDLQDERSKGSANGIWNTGWEAGGSIGFFVAGFASTDSWREEQTVLTGLGIAVFLSTAAFIVLVCRRKWLESARSALHTPRNEYRSTSSVS
jgi:predicted MFS family arabinose efflux permease